MNHYQGVSVTGTKNQDQTERHRNSGSRYLHVRICVIAHDLVLGETGKLGGVE